MNIDLEWCLGAVERSVSTTERDGKTVRTVTLSRTYRTDPADLWDALTSPERLPRWFLPVSGELEPGGRYQLEGNAEGTINVCRPPGQLDITWEFGGEMSWVEVRITDEGGGRSRLLLSHVCPDDDHWRTYGPGAAGVGWDLGLVGLALHLWIPGSARMDDAAFVASPDGRKFIVDCSRDWGRAAVAAGQQAAVAEAAAGLTAAFYLGDQPPEA